MRAMYRPAGNGGATGTSVTATNVAATATNDLRGHHRPQPSASSTSLINGPNGSWPEWSHYQAYLTWINCQLKKQGETINLVQDIRKELQDGTVVGHLMEILGQERLGGIEWKVPANSLSIKTNNYSIILRHLISRRVTLHPSITVLDLAQGNLKAQMRLVHAIAGHFKPQSVAAPAPSLNANTANTDSGAASFNAYRSAICDVPSSASSNISSESDTHILASSPLRKSKSYSSLRFPANKEMNRNGSERDVRKVTFEPSYANRNEEDSKQMTHTTNGNCPENISSHDHLRSQVKHLLKRISEMGAHREGPCLEVMEREEKKLHDLVERVLSRAEVLEEQISTYKTRIAILETAKMEGAARNEELENDISRLENDICRLGNGGRGVSSDVSTTSSNGSSSSPSHSHSHSHWDQGEFQKKLDFKNRQLAQLRRELNLKQECIAQLLSKAQADQSGTMPPSNASWRSGKLQAVHAVPLSSSDKPTTTTNGSHTLSSTKLLYYVDGSATPTRCSIPKIHTDIVLGDVKLAIDRPGVFRYYFETIDADVGRVKEEVTKDKMSVPILEDKILVFLEATTLDTHV